MDIANAYCCSAALIFFVFAAVFLQATTFSGQLEATPKLQRPNLYTSSQRAEWIHAVAGASGGWVYSADKTQKVPLQPVSAPFMGSIYGGMAMGYMGIMFLLSVYISYMATPDSASSYLFLEPRFLAIASGFLGFGTGQTVTGVFGGCGDPTGSIVGFSCFVAAAAFFDLLFVQLVDERIYMYLKWAGIQTMAIVPLFFFLSGEVPGVIQSCCGILVAAATVANGVDLAFHGWNSEQQQQQQSLPPSEVVQAAGAAASLDWNMGPMAVGVPAAAAATPLGNKPPLDFYSRKRN